LFDNGTIERFVTESMLKAFGFSIAGSTR